MNYSLIIWSKMPESHQNPPRWHILEESRPTVLCGRRVPDEVFVNSDDGWDADSTCQRCVEVYLSDTLTAG